MTRDYLVAALIRRGDQLLLVRQQGPDDPEAVWVLPGGVVEAGELLGEALARGVREETGLQMTDVTQLVYMAQLDNPNSHVESRAELPRPGQQATAFVFEAGVEDGQLSALDPDDYVSEAAFVGKAEAIERLEKLPWRFMREPITAYLRGETGPGAVWFYRRQADGNDALVGRIAGYAVAAAQTSRGAGGTQVMPAATAAQTVEPSPQRTIVVLGCLAVALVFVVLIIVGVITVTHWTP